MTCDDEFCPCQDGGECINAQPPRTSRRLDGTEWRGPGAKPSGEADRDRSDPTRPEVVEVVVHMDDGTTVVYEVDRDGPRPAALGEEPTP